MRLVWTWIGNIAGINTMKRRKKKPFNPMLGETYEFVNEHYRLIAEKI